MFIDEVAMQETFQQIIERDTYNSLLYALQGGLLLLSTYHLMMFFQNRNRAYLLYSFYTFFSLLAYIYMAESGFLLEIAKFFKYDFHSKNYSTIIFNSLYFLFFAEFLRIKQHNKTHYKIITYPAVAFISIATISYLLLRIFNFPYFFEAFRDAFVYLVSLHFLLCFYLLLQLKNDLKYFILFGGVTLFLTSIIGEKSVREQPWINISMKMGDAIYYLGVVIENCAFSFALGYQQKLDMEEKISVHNNFIEELKKNEILKDRITLENEKRLVSENEAIKYLQEISDLKLTVLQSQINPHFIFNALNSIKYYILENESKIAADYLTKFSQMIRTILTASMMKEFTLQEEIQTLKVYMDIENLRFNNEMDFSVNVSPNIDLSEIKLPPLVLQPFLENAILHGIATVKDKKITLTVNPDQNNIKIMIRDYGVGRRKTSSTQISAITQPSMGLKIAHGMMRNYFGQDAYKIEFTDLYEDENPAGTLVTVEIPKTA